VRCALSIFPFQRNALCRFSYFYWRAWPDHGLFVVDHALTDEADSDDDATEVSQVEDVVRLGGRRQQTGHRLLVDVHRCTNQLFTQHKVLVLLLFRLQRSIINPSIKQSTIFTDPGEHTDTAKSLAVDRIADRTGCQWPSRSSKVDDFHPIWKDVCDFLLMINSNLRPISHRFRDTATYSLKLSIKNCGQTAADGDMVANDGL